MKNLLRQRLREGRATTGLWVTLESPTITEIAAELGLDWVCVDMEHGHLGYREVLEHLRAAQRTDTTVLVRIPDIAQHLVKRVLDMGAAGIIVPMVRSRGDVDLGLRWARYPPRGARGFGGERAVRWGLGARAYVETADDEVMVIPLIETAEAVAAIDDILAAPGLDAIFFGPADLSASTGALGAWEGPGVAETILDIKRRAAERGIASGVLARDSADRRRRQAQGFGMVGLGSDTGLLIAALRQALAPTVSQESSAE